MCSTEQAVAYTVCGTNYRMSAYMRKCETFYKDLQVMEVISSGYEQRIEI